VTVKKYFPLIFILLIVLITGCNGEDVKGKIVIKYDNNWTGVITLDHAETNISGSGIQVFTYKNPDFLQVSAVKQDGSQEKLTVYIYEDDRIVAGDSTRDPEGSATAYYEYPY